MIPGHASVNTKICNLISTSSETTPENAAARVRRGRGDSIQLLIRKRQLNLELETGLLRPLVLSLARSRCL